MGLGPRSPHKAGRRFPAGGKRGRGAAGPGRPSDRQRQPCPAPDGRPPSAPDAHPHLSPEALGYFRRALSALKEAPEAGEERGGRLFGVGPRAGFAGPAVECRQGPCGGFPGRGDCCISRVLPRSQPRGSVMEHNLLFLSVSLKYFFVFPELMVHNVLKEVEAQALALATNRTGSEMLQELLGFSPLKPLCGVLAALRPSLRSVACHRCGVHVLQSALQQLPRLLGGCAEQEEEKVAEEEEEEEAAPPLETLEELVLGLASEVCDDFLFYCGDTHGSFVVRTLLQVLGGTLLESERARHRGSRSPGKYYRSGEWAPRKGEFRKFRRR